MANFIGILDQYPLKIVDSQGGFISTDSDYGKY